MARTHIVTVRCESAPGVVKSEADVRFTAASTEQLIGKVYAGLEMQAALNPECLMVAEFPTDTDRWIQLKCISDYTLLEVWQNTPDKPEFPDHNATNPVVARGFT